MNIKTCSIYKYIFNRPGLAKFLWFFHWKTFKQYKSFVHIWYYITLVPPPIMCRGQDLRFNIIEQFQPFQSFVFRWKTMRDIIMSIFGEGSWMVCYQMKGDIWYYSSNRTLGKKERIFSWYLTLPSFNRPWLVLSLIPIPWHGWLVSPHKLITALTLTRQDFWLARLSGLDVHFNTFISI